jgi:uncharacterized protein YpuA (DUF1002 family)|tara:strand:- start:479 stop:874 length:396 start_codon:yes stop_codon:yes gene_type:complete
MRTQLLCTFTTQKNLEQTTHDISKNFNVVFEKIYVLQNETKPYELICTYNVDKDDDVDFNKVKNTISLHRKKITNTLYTINALNELIKTINNGVLDTKYQVPWDIYRNMILILGKEGLSKIPTRILKIIDL